MAADRQLLLNQAVTQLYIILHIVGRAQDVECSTTVNGFSSGTMMSARECCVNSADGLSYSIPGQCHTCIGMYIEDKIEYHRNLY